MSGSPRCATGCAPAVARPRDEYLEALATRADAAAVRSSGPSARSRSSTRPRSPRSTGSRVLARRRAAAPSARRRAAPPGGGRRAVRRPPSTDIAAVRRAGARRRIVRRASCASRSTTPTSRSRRSGTPRPPRRLARTATRVSRAVELFEARGRRDGAPHLRDLLTELAAAIRNDDAPLLAALRRRYRVGLIDEFQDTDPTQWGIFERLFLERPGHALVVVGDPKQAIYGFRGADVDTYLVAQAAPADTSTAPGLGVERARHELPVGRRAPRCAQPPLLAGRTSTRRAHRLRGRDRGARDADARLVDEAGATAVPLSIRVSTADGAMGVRRRRDRRGVRRRGGGRCSGPSGRPRRHRSGGDRGRRRRPVRVERAVPAAARGVPAPRHPHDGGALRRRAALPRRARRRRRAARAARPRRRRRGGCRRALVVRRWMVASRVRRQARQRLAAWGDALDTRGVAALARALTDPRLTTGLLGDATRRAAADRRAAPLRLLAATAPPNAGAAQLYDVLEELVAGDASAAAATTCGPGGSRPTLRRCGS